MSDDWVKKAFEELVADPENFVLVSSDQPQQDMPQAMLDSFKEILEQILAEQVALGNLERLP